MDLHHQRDVVGRIVDPGAEVRDASAIRRSDLHQLRAALLHHIRDAKAAADFDQFASRHRNAAVAGECGQDQHHRGRAVVDDHRRFGPDQPSEQSWHCSLSRASFAGVEVEFEIAKASVLMHAVRGPPEVGV